MTEFFVVIPSRYGSTRLPGKPLLDLNGKPMIQRVYERAIESGAMDVIIATDDKRIADAAESFGAKVCMTAEDHQSGMERIAEVIDLLGWDDTQVIVNLQGDEPSMSPILIDQCANLLIDTAADISTLASPFLTRNDFESPNCVKVVCDLNDYALYFSRSIIPYACDSDHEGLAMRAALHHHGIYAYRCGVLRQMVAAESSSLEVSEKLEQLRALSLGMTIAVGTPEERPGVGIDTPEDLYRAAAELT